MSEPHRNVLSGSAMVTALEKKAREAGCNLMYVEIALEQNGAIGFWENNGFEALYNEKDEPKLSSQQIMFFEKKCFRFFDTRQYFKKM